MKKQALVFFVSLFFISSLSSVLFAEPLNNLKEFLEIDEDDEIPTSKKIIWFPTVEPEISLTWGTKIPFRRDLRSPAPSEELIFSYDAKEFRFDGGLQYQANQFDFTSHFFYMPTFYNTFQAGIGVNFHFYRYFKEFSEYDLIGTLRFRWIRGPVFSLDWGAGYLYKIASIDAVSSYTPRIYNLSYNFDLILKWKIGSAFAFWCGLKLQDYFDYALAISPFYKVGFDIKCNSNMTFGLDCTLKYIDMFFSAVYLNEANLRLTCKVAI